MCDNNHSNQISNNNKTIFLNIGINTQLFSRLCWSICQKYLRIQMQLSHNLVFNNINAFTLLFIRQMRYNNSILITMQLW